MRWLLTLVFIVSYLPQLGAQSVETVAQHRLINDGLWVDPAGVIYSGAGGLRRQTQIARISPDGVVTGLGDQFAGAIDLCQVGDSLLVTNYDDNSVKAFDIQQNTTRTVIRDLDGPAGIVGDGRFLYLTEYGAPPKYQGSRIVVADATDFRIVRKIDDPRLQRPQGIVRVDDNEFIVVNSQDGRMFRWDAQTGSLTDFTMLGLNTVNITYRDSLIYAANNRAHRLTVVDREGRFMTFAGNGTPKTEDGSLRDAQFLNPLGVAFAPDRKSLYVSQAKDGALRKIEMPAMPESLEHDLKSVGFFKTAEGIAIPQGVTELTLFRMGKTKVVKQKLKVADSLVAFSEIPFDDFVATCKVGNKFFGLRHKKS